MKTDLVVGGYGFHNNKLLLVLHKLQGLWLPVGGHIEENETPDDALRREFKEETGLEIVLLDTPSLPMVGNIKKHLARPFYSNVHTCKDHDHACAFYICEIPDTSTLKLNKELKEYIWVKENQVKDDRFPLDVQAQAQLAFNSYYSLR